MLVFSEFTVSIILKTTSRVQSCSDGISGEISVPLILQPPYHKVSMCSLVGLSRHYPWFEFLKVLTKYFFKHNLTQKEIP